MIGSCEWVPSAGSLPPRWVPSTGFPLLVPFGGLCSGRLVWLGNGLRASCAFSGVGVGELARPCLGSGLCCLLSGNDFTGV